jgi:alpha-beta hydrolase superfamily lysophospholipase
MTAPLPRRALLGFSVTAGPPLAVARILPDGPADRAGLRPDDVLLRLDETPLLSAAALHLALRRCVADRPVVISLSRDGVPSTATLHPIERPRAPDTRYDETDGAHGRLRVLATGPAEGPRAVVLYLQGVGTSTVEAAPESPLGALCAALAREHIAVLRVDRAGVGDSEGPAPQTLGFFDALDDAHRLVAWALAQPAYATAPLTLLGHSLGGLLAPLLAQPEPAVRSMLLYGVGSLPWPDYLARHARAMLTLAPRDDGEAWLTRLAHRNDRLLVHRRTLDEFARECPAFARRPADYGVADDHTLDGHALRFWQEVTAIDPVATLCEAARPTTVAWGTSDHLSYRDEHEDLVAALASAHPGRARGVILPETDHGFVACASPAKSFRQRGQGPLSPHVPRAIVDHLAWVDGGAG